ncbi:MAG TPA: hypothetical protein VLS49_14535 [Usitatibacter sp.]|nr:hypothetical protein [Usitatibacter sp.]
MSAPERPRRRLASPQDFRRRLIGTGSIGLALIAISLVIGIAGYATTEHLGLLDAFLNAAMILSGMGPLHEPRTAAGKLFAGFYAIYSGFAVLGIAAIMFSPVVHRLFHRFHIADTDEDPRV